MMYPVRSLIYVLNKNFRGYLKKSYTSAKHVDQGEGGLYWPIWTKQKRQGLQTNGPKIIHPQTLERRVEKQIADTLDFASLPMS